MENMVNNETITSQPKTYKVDEIAEILSIGRTAAYALVKEGHFKSVRIGSAIRVSRLSFDAWLNEHVI